MDGNGVWGVDDLKSIFSRPPLNHKWLMGTEHKREKDIPSAPPLFSRSSVHILPVVAVKRVVQYSHACYSLAHPPFPMSTSRAACVGADKMRESGKGESATVEMIQSSPFIFIQFYSRGGLGWKARWTRKKSGERIAYCIRWTSQAGRLKSGASGRAWFDEAPAVHEKFIKSKAKVVPWKFPVKKKDFFTNGHIHQHSDTEYDSGWISSIGRGPLWRFIVIPSTRKKKLKGSYRDEIVFMILLVFIFNGVQWTVNEWQWTHNNRFWSSSLHARLDIKVIFGRFMGQSERKSLGFAILDEKTSSRLGQTRRFEIN